MTELEARQKICNQIDSWIGISNNGNCPKEIVTIYNDFISNNTEKWGTLPRSSKMSTTYAWCAATVSCAAIKCGYAMTIFPVEMSCGNIIKMAKTKNIWCEDESTDSAYQIGNAILYDWQDDGNGDNTGSADHIGIITKVNGDVITVTEGNYSKTVKQRTLKKNAKYIRGIVCPDYASIADQEETTSIVMLNLSSGAKGNLVKTLQLLLNGKCGTKLAIDGSFGSKTLNAVKSAQSQYGLSQSGIVTVSLWNKLINE